MKIIFLFLSICAPLCIFAQDTIIVRTETAGTFETITYEEVSFDTSYTESSYTSSEGGTITIFRNATVSNERIAPKKVKEDLIKLSIHPNPGTGLFEVTSSKAFGHIEVFSIIGEDLFSKETGELSRTFIDLTGLNNGIYFIKVTFFDGSSRSKRVVKQ